MEKIEAKVSNAHFPDLKPYRYLELMLGGLPEKTQGVKRKLAETDLNGVQISFCIDNARLTCRRLLVYFCGLRVVFTTAGGIRFEALISGLHQT